MILNDLEHVLEAAAKGDERGYRLFFTTLWRDLKPALTRLTNSEQTGKDLFLSSMITFWEVFVVQQKPLPNNVKGYVFAICRNGWYAQKRWAPREISQDPFNMSEQFSDAGSYPFREEEARYQRQRAMAIALEEATEKCQCLFEQHIERGIALKDLEKPLGYPSYQAIVQAKYNCKKRLIARVFQLLQKQKPVILTAK